MQITKNIHALKIPFQIPVAPDKMVDRFVFLYLIYTDRIWLIDTGVAAAEPVITDYIRKSGKNITDIAGIILTHAHPDHIGSAKSLQETSACMIAAHSVERNWIEDVGLQARERLIPGFHSLVGGSVRVDRTLKGGDIIEMGKGHKLEVIETPGHSNGSISFLLREQGSLFSGDAVPLPGEMPIYEDAVASMTSIRKLKTIPGISYLLSSWDEPREGQAAYDALNNGARYLERIHKAVREFGDPGSENPADFCAPILQDLGLPAAMANPLVARSFRSNLRTPDRQSLSGGRNNE
jgi:hydroxyacylglutathione hydrolase